MPQCLAAATSQLYTPNCWFLDLLKHSTLYDPMKTYLATSMLSGSNAIQATLSIEVEPRMAAGRLVWHTQQHEAALGLVYCLKHHYLGVASVCALQLISVAACVNAITVQAWHKIAVAS